MGIPDANVEKIDKLVGEFTRILGELYEFVKKNNLPTVF
jgi:hypothetical protein